MKNHMCILIPWSLHFPPSETPRRTMPSSRIHEKPKTEDNRNYIREALMKPWQITKYICLLIYWELNTKAVSGHKNENITTTNIMSPKRIHNPRWAEVQKDAHHEAIYDPSPQENVSRNNGVRTNKSFVFFQILVCVFSAPGIMGFLSLQKIKKGYWAVANEQRRKVRPKHWIMGSKPFFAEKRKSNWCKMRMEEQRYKTSFFSKAWDRRRSDGGYAGESGDDGVHRRKFVVLIILIKARMFLFCQIMKVWA